MATWPRLRSATKLWFLKQEERLAFEQRPKQANQSQRTVRKLIFALTSTLRAPMPIERLQVRVSRSS